MELVKQKQNTKILKTILIIFFGTILLTLSAKIKIPFYPVPMTMQTFVVLFLGLCSFFCFFYVFSYTLRCFARCLLH